ncbi:MAG: 2-oxoglutarate dehydrogenase complex dihydrolipoyllysine-residue succinyltransferase [Planctomycetota bacterium]
MVEIKVPEFGESIQEVQVAVWLKQPGDWVDLDEDIVELESEKASQALACPESGYLRTIKVSEGEFANVGDVLCELEKGEKPAGGANASSSATATAEAGGSATVVADAPPSVETSWIMPAAERILSEYKISADAITPTGPGGRLLKEDVLNYIEAKGLKPGARSAPSAPPVAPPKPVSDVQSFNDELGSLGFSREETVKPMSMIRRTIASRLVEAQQSAALLTTFNEIDMKPVMDLRKKYKEQFLQKHGVKLGFMSFFAKASVEALKRFPAINCEIRGTDVVSRNYYDIGIAIGGGKGLVVPILRSVERISFADIERKIGDYAELAQANKIKPDDLTGGTFTISNGGVYGSLLSTPIVNPPQSGILGLHTIQERPVALNGEVVIRPMMYIALSYDHRIVDGREAVGFLKTIKEVLEEPARLFLEV